MIKFKEVKLTPNKLMCIFAHPDDEAFGPGGTIAHFAKTCEVYIVCVTNGDADEKFSKGQDVSNLGKVRRKELNDSAKILGVKEVIFLDFKDGSLNNNNYHDVTKALEPIIERIKPDTLITFDPNGVSGHLDHIAVSMEVSYLFERTPFVKTLMYFCEKKEIKDIIGQDYFVYFPQGYSKDEVQLVMDVRPYFDTKVKTMRAHVSQKEDCDMVLDLFKDHLKEEYFRIISK